MSSFETVVPPPPHRAEEVGTAVSSSPGAWVLYEGSPAPGGEGPLATGPGWWSTNRVITEAEPVGFSHLSANLALNPPLLVLTDADSTLFHEEAIDELARLAGVFDQVSKITESAMRGEMGFDDSLRRRVALLQGLPTSAFEEVGSQLTLASGAAELITWTHSVGAQFGVVSGGFEEILRPLVQQLGVDYLLANRLEVEGELLTGRTVGPVVNDRTKEQCVKQWSQGRADRVVAVGDGSNDIRMLKAAGLGIAFCAKPAVRQAVSSQLNIRRLDAVVGLLGRTL
ncbi:phosphoserine phosphatase SerB [Actinomyces minihominis]|uniref:phosphoserine phosphatase SerB n=1 Tax=Actinomyces minihominis TaxID=2002838 RepID=UPI000C06EE67|nr:phosphoserine phosphatase SerB [Actinomyces minihominis]